MPRTDARPARAPRRRLDAVLLFDKPAGMSSNGCLGYLKRLFEADKAGHTGTLDPFANINTPGDLDQLEISSAL